MRAEHIAAKAVLSPQEGKLPLRGRKQVRAEGIEACDFVWRCLSTRKKFLQRQGAQWCQMS